MKNKHFTCLCGYVIYSPGSDLLPGEYIKYPLFQVNNPCLQVNGFCNDICPCLCSQRKKRILDLVLHHVITCSKDSTSKRNSTLKSSRINVYISTRKK